MNKQFKQRNFKGVKEEYIKLIKDLRDYEKRYNMVVLDDVYVIKTIICIEIYFKIIIVNFASFIRISTHKF